jgi:hypothetical protein
MAVAAAVICHFQFVILSVVVGRILLGRTLRNIGIDFGAMARTPASASLKQYDMAKSVSSFLHLQTT